MGILSVCLSVTSRYGFNARSDRDSGSSPHVSVESLVSYEVIWCQRGGDSPRTTASKKGAPSLEFVILPLLAHLAWKRLQIDTYLLLIIASTADELSSGTNIDDLERPWTPKIWVLANFQRFSAAIHTLRMNCAETIQDRPGQPAYEMFGIKRRFQRLRVDPLGSRSPPYQRIKFRYPL